MSLRVLIADDSSFARSLIREILESDSGICVVGEAKDGGEAVAMARALRPDIMTMDLKMPVMDGIEAITEIMASSPIPILVVSSAADAHDAYRAVQRGALETLGKPDTSESSRAEFVARVKLLSAVKVITHIRTMQAQHRAQPVAAFPGDHASPEPLGKDRDFVLFAVASSTGGPQALAHILGSLPSDFPSPVLISQHIADGFAQGLAKWLSTLCRLQVKLAADGDAVQPGTVYLSPSEKNLSVTTARKIMLLDRMEGQIYHPVCDVLLGSVASVYGRLGIGIILTGMSEDGAAGIEMIRDAGGYTIAQDEATSVVFGMNKAAIERRAVARILPLQDISAEMCRLSLRFAGEARQ